MCFDSRQPIQETKGLKMPRNYKQEYENYQGTEASKQDRAQRNKARRMLEKKGLYKLNVGKEYNFRGEDMIKNLYFSDKDLVEKTCENGYRVPKIAEEDDVYVFYQLMDETIKTFFKEFEPGILKTKRFILN